MEETFLFFPELFSDSAPVKLTSSLILRNRKLVVHFTNKNCLEKNYTDIPYNYKKVLNVDDMSQATLYSVPDGVKRKALYRGDKSKPWQVLDDYTLNVLAEFKTCSEAEDYARSHGQSVLIITYNEYHELMD